MDVEAEPIGNDIWHLTDLLGRAVGSIIESSRGFMVEPKEGGILIDVDQGPYGTLPLAMVAIGKQSRGACRLKRR